MEKTLLNKKGSIKPFKISKPKLYITSLILTCGGVALASLADNIDSNIFTNQIGGGYQAKYLSEGLSNMTGISGWSSNEILGHGSWRFGDIYVAGEYSQDGITIAKDKSDFNKLFKQDNTLKINGSYVWHLKPNELELATGVAGYLQQIQVQAKDKQALTNTYLDTNQERRGAGITTRLGWNIIENLKFTGGIDYYPIIQNNTSGNTNLPDKLQMTEFVAGLDYELIENVNVGFKYKRQVWNDWGTHNYSSTSDGISVGLSLNTPFLSGQVAAKEDKQAEVSFASANTLTNTILNSYNNTLTIPETIPELKVENKIEDVQPKQKESNPFILYKLPAPTDFQVSNTQKVSQVPNEYTVQIGDNLAKISKDVLGDSGQWMSIYKANSNIMKNPHDLTVGQKIIIPLPYGQPIQPIPNYTSTTVTTQPNPLQKPGITQNIKELNTLLGEQTKYLKQISTVQQQTKLLYDKLANTSAMQSDPDKIIKIGLQIARNEKILANVKYSDNFTKSFEALVKQRLEYLKYLQQLHKNTVTLYKSLEDASKKYASSYEIVKIADLISKNEKILKAENFSSSDLTKSLEELKGVKVAMEDYYSTLNYVKAWKLQ